MTTTIWFSPCSSSKGESRGASRRSAQGSDSEWPLSGIVALGMPALGMGQGQPTGKPRRFPVLASVDHKVSMIGHQAPGQNLGTIPLDSLLKKAFESYLFAIFLEENHAGIAATQHMAGQATIRRMLVLSPASNLSKFLPKTRNPFLTAVLRGYLFFEKNFQNSLSPGQPLRHLQFVRDVGPTKTNQKRVVT
jgi:hypothetical protein